MTPPTFTLRGCELRPAREPDQVLAPARRAGGTPEDDARVQAGQALLSALADARNELARRLSLVNAGLVGLAVFSPVFGVITLVAGGAGFEEAERVLSAVDDVLGGTGPRLLERIDAGDASRLEALRTLVANVTTTIEQTIVDVDFTNSGPMRFLREVVAQSFVDLQNLARNLPDALPKVGVGIGIIALSLLLLRKLFD